MSLPLPWLEPAWQFLTQRTLLTHQPTLFSGAEGRGQWVLALHAVAALLCERQPQSFVACGQCIGCRAWERREHPDVWLFSSAEESFGVDQARDILVHTAQRPHTQAGVRVVLIDGFDRATVAAQQALLKTFEEPVANTWIAATAYRLAAVLPTIRSRCAVLRLPAVSRTQFVAYTQQQDPRWYAFTNGSPLRLAGLDCAVLVQLQEEMNAYFDKKSVSPTFLKGLLKLEKTLAWEWVYFVLTQRAQQALQAEDVQRIQGWQQLWRAMAEVKSLQWGLQCQGFFGG